MNRSEAVGSAVRVRRMFLRGARALVLTAGLLLVAAACVSAAPRAVRVFAASSLTNAFEDIGQAFEAANPEVRLKFHFAGTATLRAQIEHGARADVFASADPDHAAALHDRGLIGRPRAFAHNRMVAVFPRTGSGHVGADLGRLARRGTRVVLAGPQVPAGRYAREALRKLSSPDRMGVEFAERVLANVVSEETSVRAVLSKVSLGEADAGIVYETDARRAPDRVVRVPLLDGDSARVTCVISTVARSGATRGARAFVSFVHSAAAMAILRDHGFEP